MNGDLTSENVAFFAPAARLYLESKTCVNHSTTHRAVDKRLAEPAPLAGVAYIFKRDERLALGPPRAALGTCPITRRDEGSAACSRQDFLDHHGLGVGIILHILPVQLCQAPFGVFVKLAINGIAAQPVPQSQNAMNFRTARRKNVQVDVCTGPFEQSVFVPVGFPYA